MFSLTWRWHLDHTMIYSASFNSLKNSGGRGGNPHIYSHMHAQCRGGVCEDAVGETHTSTLGKESIITHLSALQFTPGDFTHQPIQWKRLHFLEHNKNGTSFNVLIAHIFSLLCPWNTLLLWFLPNQELLGAIMYKKELCHLAQYHCGN